jgi:hypothetical protein
MQHHNWAHMKLHLVSCLKKNRNHRLIISCWTCHKDIPFYQFISHIDTEHQRGEKMGRKSRHNSFQHSTSMLMDENITITSSQNELYYEAQGEESTDTFTSSTSDSFSSVLSNADFDSTDTSVRSFPSIDSENEAGNYDSDMSEASFELLVDVETDGILPQIQNDKEFQAIFQFYQQIRKMHVTNAQYVSLIQTEVIQSSKFYHMLPKTLPTFTRYIGTKLGTLIVRREATIAKDKVSYLLISDVIRLWLLSPSIKKQLIQCNKENTLPYVDNMDLLKEKHNECDQSNIFTEMWSGKKWYEILIETYNSWQPSYSKIRTKQNITPLFLHIILFNDEFGWMGVGKGELKQIVYIVTAGEFNHGQRKSKKIINIPILLAKAKHDRENSHLLQQLFTEDINDLSKGKIFNVLGDVYFVVAMVHAIVGDLPARKSIVGMTSSVTSTLPCHSCKVFAKDFKNKRTV